MRKTVTIILAICFGTSCKTSHYTAINDRKEGVRITLPKSSESVSPKSLDGLYSGEFYKEYPAMKYPPMNAQIYTWDYIYRITPDIILGFKYGNPRIVEEKDMKKERGEFGYVCEQRSDRKNFRMKDEVINSRLYWLCLYKSKNLEDHFVEFRSDMTKVNRVWGAIRFPASYPLEEIEKQTTQILSGIKFEK